MSQKPKVLLIDDDPAVIAILSARLEGLEGFEVLAALAPEAGIIQAKKLRPQAILLDWMLPGMNGLGVMDRLKSFRRTFHIPVFMLTSRNTMGDVEMALERGAAGYFTKPLDIKKICERLKREIAVSDPGVAK